MSSRHATPAPPEGQAPSPPAPSGPSFRSLKASQLLPPLNPAREHFDENALADLLESIPKVGIIQNLVVEQEGDMFRVHAGHRRMVAAQALDWQDVPCMVYPPGDAPGEAIKHHENKDRENLNPAEEARYFGRLLESDCGGDVDQLCLLVKEGRGYVEGRLMLLQGAPEVLAELGAGLISIGVAHELNLIDDPPTRLMYLDAAMRGGATVRMVRDWRIQWQQSRQYSDPAIADTDPAGAAAPIQAQTTMKCFLCDGDEEPHTMELLFVHKPCRKMLLDQWLRRIKGEPEDLS